MKDILRKKWLLGVTGTVILAAIAISIFLITNNMPKVKGSTVTIPINKDKLVVQVCTDNILQVHYLPLGKSTPNTEVVGNTSWSPVEASIDIKSDPMVIKTNSMVIEIDKKTNKISVFDSKNNLLLKEQNPISWSQDSVDFNHQVGQNL